MLRNLNQSFSGRRICGTPFVGKLASEIPTGFPVAPFLLDDIDAAFPNRRYRVIIKTGPGGGATLDVLENSAYTLTTTSDGTYGGDQTVEKYDPDVGLFSREDTTYTINVGNSVAADLTAAYTVLAAVNADLGGAYALLNAVSSDLAGSYAISAGGVGPVSADFAGAYQISALVSADLAAAYGITSSAGTTPVQVDFAGAYAIAAYVSASLAGSYSVDSITTYARAPSGNGYTPQRNEGQGRPGQGQRNYR